MLPAVTTWATWLIVACDDPGRMTYVALAAIALTVPGRNVIANLRHASMSAGTLPIGQGGTFRSWQTMGRNWGMSLPPGPEYRCVFWF